MIDDHIIPETVGWGIKPILFNIGNFGIPSYSFFLILGFLVGLGLYIYYARKENKMNENTFFIIFGALIGGTLGAKIPIWIINYKLIIANWTNLTYILSGRTIVGGLIGGTLGAYVTKKIFNIKVKRGNLFAPSIAIGDSIGRIGCFLRGCCYGKPTNMNFGVNFGDNILRYPTQLFESFFAFLMFIYLLYFKKNKKDLKDGELFLIFMNYYFIFRFFIEFIRVEMVVLFGLTIFQLAAIGVIVYLNKNYWLKWFNKKNEESNINTFMFYIILGIFFIDYLIHLFH